MHPAKHLFLVAVMSLPALSVALERPAVEPETIRADRLGVLLPRILQQRGIDLWLVFTREGAVDPVASTIGVDHIVARGAFLFSRSGERYRKQAILASYDADSVRATGLYDQVLSYKSEGIKPHLKRVVEELDPKRIAVNFARDVPVADGLTHGMRRYLDEVLGATYAERMVSAQELVVDLLGTKLPMEIAALRYAVEATQSVIREALTPQIIRPGVTAEMDLHRHFEQHAPELGCTIAFSSVVVGPSRGHSEPTDRVIQRGDLVRIDFGYRCAGYAADIQRTAYVLKQGESEAPAAIRRLWEVTLQANRAARAALKVGATGLEVDTAGRSVITGAGFDEYPHGTGHAIGVQVHDVGAMLGPDWPERYGEPVRFKIGADQVYAIEPILYTEYAGAEIHIGLEEDVLVTPSGPELLGTAQEELILIP
ncbi:MAG TPA: M24 family metallopeptidase [Acidobacteriota bacterium]